MTDDVDALQGAHRGAGGTRGRARPGASRPGRAVPDRRGGQRRRGPAGVLRDGPRDRRRADGRRELLHRPLRRRAPGDQLPVLRRHGRHRHPGPGGLGPDRRGRRGRGRTAYVLRTGQAAAHRRRPALPSLIASGEVEAVGAPSSRGLGGRPADRRGSDPRRDRGPDATTPTSIYTRRRPGAAGLRRPAHRLRAQPRPGDRGDAPAQRRAGPRQRDRRRARAGSSTSTRSSSSSANASGRSSTRGRSFIALYDAATTRSSVPVRDRRGRAASTAASSQLGPGLTSTVIRTGRPLRLGTARGAGRGTAPIQVGGTDTQSWLGVPILAGERVIGVVGLESVERARLQRSRRAPAVDARLEHGRRPRERAPVRRDEAPARPRRTSARPSWRSSTSVQHGLAEQLDMQAMYELVGERDPRRSSTPQVVDIAVSTTRTPSLIHFPYAIERGVRVPDEPIPLVGFRRHVLETREPLARQSATCAGGDRRPSATRQRSSGRAAEVRLVRARSSPASDVIGVIVAPEPRPRARLHRGRRPAARRPSPRA